MKVLLVTDYFYPFNPGGTEWSVYELARSLKKNKVNTKIVTLNYGAKSEELFDGLEIIRLPFFKKISSKRKVVNPIWQNNPIFFLVSTIQILKLIQEEGPDILHIHGKFLIPAGVIAGFLKNKPIVISIRDKQMLCPIGKCFFDPKRKKSCKLVEYVTRDIPWFYENYTQDKSIIKFIHVFLGSLTNRISYQIVQILAKKANKIIAISQSQKAYLEANGFKNIDVIYNTATFTQPKSRILKEKKVLFAGKLSRGKGSQILINTIKNLVPKSNIKFIFAGNIDEKNIPKEKGFRRKAKFLGGVNHQKLASLYKSVSAVVTPSVYPESFGRVALESLSCGTPVVVTNIGGLPEIVKDHETGRVVEANSEDLAKALLEVVNNEGVYKDNIKKVYPSLKKKFYTNPINQHLKLYKSLT